jgi:SnoaL-like domain
MSTEKNVQTVKDFFAAIGRGDRQTVRALSAEDIEWIIPGENWPLAGTRRGHAGLADLLQTHAETMKTSFMEPREFVAQGDLVLVIGFARRDVLLSLLVYAGAYLVVYPTGFLYMLSLVRKGPGQSAAAAPIEAGRPQQPVRRLP